MRLRYYCHFAQLTGYGRAAHDYLLALKRHTDIELEIAPFTEGTYLEDRYAELKPLVGFNHGYEQHLYIFHASPQKLARYANLSCPKVAMTTWETQPLPLQWAEVLTKYDAVIVPSELTARILRDAGVNVFVVPHCFDPGFWQRAPEREVRNEYRFYTIGRWSERKNMGGLLKAFFHAFNQSDHVSLTILSHNADFAAIRSLIEQTGIPKSELPGLRVITKLLTEQELLSIHRNGDCYVSATRGESWALGGFEAALMGNAVIMPNWGGQIDYLEDYLVGFLPDVMMTPVFLGPSTIEKKEVAPGKRMVIKKTPRTQEAGINCYQMWAEPDLMQLIEELRFVKSHRMRDFDGSGLHMLTKRFTYEVVATKLNKILEEINVRGKNADVLPAQGINCGG